MNIKIFSYKYVSANWVSIARHKATTSTINGTACGIAV